jgi:purine-binding chemotaxis protein CheW
VKRARRRQGAAIDWTAARERLARAEAGMSTSSELSPQRVRALMEERTRALARVPDAATAPGDVISVLSFGLGSERYAIEAACVREVARLTDLTPVPGAGDFVMGVTNLRGEVICVVDLRRFFDIPRTGLSDLSRLIVLGRERAEFGILADQAHEIGPLRSRDILAPPQSVSGIGREYLLGVTRDALIVLDARVLLRDSRLFVDQGETASQ